MPLHQTYFCKHCDKRRNCSKRANSLFDTMFSTYSHRFFKRDFPFFNKICSKSFAAELLYEGMVIGDFPGFCH